MSCPHCTTRKMTVAEFKAAFKIGDVIQGWSTGKIVRITAIGEERFLYKNEHDFGRPKERVAVIAASWLWRKVSA